MNIVRISLMCAVLAVSCSKKAGHAEGEEHEGEHEKEHGHEEGEEEEGHEDHAPGVVELSVAAAHAAGIRTATVARRTLSAQLETTGSVDFDTDRVVHVSPRFAGRLHESKVELGQDVAANDILAVIDSVELGREKAEYLKARARRELTEKNLSREEKLFEDKITSEQAVLTARAEHLEADAAFRASREALRIAGLADREIDQLRYGKEGASLYPLRAPFAATVVEKHGSRGEQVGPDKDLFTLAALDRMWVWIDVYERDIAGVHVGDHARIRAEGSGDHVFTGTVTFIRSQVDPKTRRIGARVEVQNTNRALRAGTFVRVELLDPHGKEGQAIASRLVVPEKALVRQGEDHVVFAKLGERKFEKRVVQIGRKAIGEVEILTGLREGEDVVVEGAFLLKAEAGKASMGEGHSH